MDLRQQRLERLARIGQQPHLGPGMAGDLGRVEVDADHLERIVQAPVHLDPLEARADHERDVDLRPQAMRHREADAERRAAVHHAPAHPAGDHGRAKKLGQLAHQRAGAGSAAADQNHRPLGAVQQLGSARQRLGIGLGRRRGRQQDALGRDPGLACHDVHRHLERGRARPAGGHLGKSLGDQPGGILRRLDARRPFGQAPHDAELIGQLVQQADAAADVARGDLAGEAEDRRAAGIGGGQRRRGVEKARARHDAVGRGPAARRGIAVGHVAGTLLVPGHDRPQPLAGVVQRIEERIVLHARQHEQGVDACASSASSTASPPVMRAICNTSRCPTVPARAPRPI